MNRRTVLHTIETGGPGGAETVLLILASQLDPARYRSLALVPREGWLSAALRSRGVPVHLARSRNRFDPTLLLEMRRLIHREKVDLIHSHLPDQNFYACVAGRLTDTPVIATYHGMPSDARSLRLRARTKLWCVGHSASAVAVVSDHLQQSMTSLGFPNRHLVRIYNGIETGRFTIAPSGRLRRELGRHSEMKLIGMVANVREAKGYEYFLQAAYQVAQRMPQTLFLAIGEGNNGRAENLHKLVRQLSLEDRFLFLGFRRDIPEILSDLDLFVLSSVREGFSLATVEAMAAGKPIVATRSGGPEEIVEDGRTGLLVAPGDANSLAAGICELLSDPVRACAMGRQAREKASRDFSISAMVRHYQELYAHVSKGQV